MQVSQRLLYEAHQYYEHGEDQRRREHGAHENAALVEVVLPREALPVAAAQRIQPLGTIHQSHWEGRNRRSELASYSHCASPSGEVQRKVSDF